MAELLRRPNMDTRFHLKLAVVERVVVDPQEGIFADVTLTPNEEPETVFVGAPYAGGGFGFYFPLEEGDTVLIGIPDGNWLRAALIAACTSIAASSMLRLRSN